MKIIKFGGTSMGDAKVIQKAAKISVDLSHKDKLIVVVSAMSGVTDMLIKVCEEAKLWKFKTVKGIIQILKDRHYVALESIVWKHEVGNIWQNSLEHEFQRLEIMSEWICLLKDVSDRNRAMIVYFGEVFSSLLMVEAIKKNWRDSMQIMSKNIIRTNTKYLDADVDFSKTKSLCNNVFKNIDMKKVIPVVTGFAWWDEKKDVNLLGRGWSDYVATILWWALKVDWVDIWTDVNGIFSADPRIIKESVVWPELDYSICAELALAGAKVLHPKTLLPAMINHIPVYVKNTFNPKYHWTKISTIKSTWLKWINLNNNQVLILFVDNEMFWAVGYINKVTDLFMQEKIPIDSLVTSEVSISLSIEKLDLTKRFLQILKKNHSVKIIDNVSKISLVWEDIWKDGRLLAQVFEVLKDYKIHFVGHSSSGKNITLFVDKDKSSEILKKLHKKLF